VEIGVDPDLRVRDACAVSEAVEQSIRGHVRNMGEVMVQVRPAADTTGTGVPHVHAHDHGDGRHDHGHEHVHDDDHQHPHEEEAQADAAHTLPHAPAH
jgi:hypothetical protein